MSPDPAPGRSCPLHYRYAPEVFREPPAQALRGLDVLYVVGGLYGNELALREVLRLFDAERGRKGLVFNGDFHWFDADPAVFARIQREVLVHAALRGNVETELSATSPDFAAGCGCAYPEWVGDAVVERSNRILQRLWHAATPGHRTQLAALPMWLTASVGELRIGIAHGDAESLAGWGFAQEHLRESAHRARVQAWFERAGVDAFACSHTCLPVFQPLPGPAGSQPRWVFNNGAAGMPNFRGDTAGLLTRIALWPAQGLATRAGVVTRGVHVNALALEIDAGRMQRDFLAQWPAGSDAHASYFGRLMHGPDYHAGEVVRLD